MKKLLSILVSVLFGVCLLVGAASALTLRLDDPSTGGIDAEVAGAGGIVTFGPSALGSTKWTVNNVTGLSQPILGSSSVASMDLNSINVTASGPATLILSLSDTFTLPFPPAIFPSLFDKMEIGGTTVGTVTYDKWIGTEEFQQTTKIGTLGTFPAGAFSGSLTGSFTNSGPFSMTEIITITHPGSGQTSFNATNDATIPEPTTMLLLGSGLLGMGVYARKRFRK
jgi:hypothetical protein